MVSKGVAITAVMGLLLIGPVHAQDWTGLAASLGQSVLRVELRRAETNAVCSAVVFDITPDGRAHALTAAHCVAADPTERVDVTIDRRAARTMLSNRILDLAIVQFRPNGATATVRLATDTPPPGSPVIAAGYAFGVDEIVYQFGHVAQARNRETKALWLNMDILFGDSGGGIFDAQGRLIGVTSFLFARGPAHIGGAVSIEEVRQFLDEYRDRLAENKHK